MRSIWAVGRNTIAQAVRMKVAIIFIILLAVLLPLMGVLVTGDGTLKGKLQTFVSYGLGLTNLLLCLLTLIVSTYTISSDLKQRQIYTVLTKPIRRIELLTGKLLGVLILNLVLLILFGAVIYGFARFMPKLAKATEEIANITVSIRHDGEVEREKILIAAKEMAVKIEQEAESKASSVVAKARVELREEAARLAVELAEDMLRKQVSAEDQKRLVDEYMQKVGELN